MKNQTRKSWIMLVLLAVSLFAVIGCESDVNKSDPEVMSEEEAAQLVEALVSPEDGGCAAAIGAPSEMASRGGQSLAKTTATTFEIDTTIAYEYHGSLRDFRIMYHFVCALNNTTVPPTFDADITHTGEYEGPYLSKDGNGAAAFVFSNLLSPDYVQMDGDYQYLGSSSHHNIEEDLATVFDIQFEAVKYNLVRMMIDSGRAQFKLVVTTPQENRSEYAGTFEFLGNQQGVIIINGNRYEVDWS